MPLTFSQANVNKKIGKRPFQNAKNAISAGLSDLKFHDLRKTFGSLLAQNGISTAVTQGLM